MPGWGNVFGKVADFVQGRAERRRNNIARLRKEQDALKDKPKKTKRDIARLDVIASELGRLYKEAANQA
jgi:hypothetical protein